MAKVLGYEPKLMRKCTCSECCAIVEYAPYEEVWMTYEDGRDIVYTGLSGISSVSHTQNHAIELYLEMGCIEEIK